MKVLTAEKIRIEIEGEVFFCTSNLSVLEVYCFMKTRIEDVTYSDGMWKVLTNEDNIKTLQELLSFSIEYMKWSEKFLDSLKNKDKKEVSARVLYLRKKYQMISKRFPFLYDFQKKAVLKTAYNKHGGLLLGMSMGTGKTITSIAAALCLSENIFIVSPAPLMEQWQAELSKWFDKDSVIFKGTKGKREKLYKENEKSIKIISYDTFKNDKDNLDLRKQFRHSILICDEATKLKNKKSQRYLAISKNKNFFNWKIFLSGTPVTKALRDIHTLIQLINRGLAGSIKDFEIYEMITSGWGYNQKTFPKLVGYKDLDVYVKRIKPVYERKTLEDIGKQMPKKTIIRVDIEQDKPHHKLADLILEEHTAFTGFSLLCMLDSGITNIVNSESESVQLIEDELPTKYTENKLAVLKELVEEIDDKTLIFTRFIQTTKMLKKELQKEFKNKKIVIVDASTPNKEMIKNQFNTGDIDIVIATETWTEGVSLGEVDYLINYDVTPSVDKYLQKNDRIYRLNSTRPKFIYNLVGNVVEQHIMDILEKKLILISAVTDGQAGIMSDSDIKEEVMKKLGKR